MKRVVIVLVSAMTLCTAAITDAESDKSAAAPIPGAARNTARAVKECLFSWTTIPQTIIQVTKDSRNPLWGLTGGTIKGIAKALPRTISAFSEATAR